MTYIRGTSMQLALHMYMILCTYWYISTPSFAKRPSFPVLPVPRHACPSASNFLTHSLGKRFSSTTWKVLPMTFSQAAKPPGFWDETRSMAYESWSPRWVRLNSISTLLPTSQWLFARKWHLLISRIDQIGMAAKNRANESHGHPTSTLQNLKIQQRYKAIQPHLLQSFLCHPPLLHLISIIETSAGPRVQLHRSRSFL